MSYAKISTLLLLAAGLTVASVQPAQAAEPRPEDFTFGVAAIGPSRGQVELNWKYDSQSTYQVDEVVNGNLVPKPGATQTGWGSRNEAPGTHTYRVTRTLNGESAWSQATVVVPTRNLIGTQYVTGWLVSASSVAQSNANGATIKQDFGR